MKLAIFSILNFVVINCFSQSIKGQVLDTDTKKPLSYSSVYLVDPDNTDDTINIYYFTYLKYKIISRTKTDSIGNFSFDGLAPKMYNLVADYTMPEIKNLGLRGSRQEIDSNINMTNGSNYFKVLHLMVTCPYDKTKNQTFCPKCKRKDKVVPIIYGLPIFDKDGKINGLKSGQYALGGCVSDIYCNPSKTCFRCHLPF